MPHSGFSRHHIWPTSEPAALYVTNTLRVFSQALIGIYMPIYLFLIADKPMFLTQRLTVNSITWVILFYLIYSITILSFAPTMTNLIFGHLRFKKSVLLSTIFLSMMLLTASLMEKNFIYFIPTAIFGGIQTYMYWIPYHTFFIRKNRSKSGLYGKKYAMRLSLELLSRAAGPFIGGLVIANFGFQPLFAFSLIITALSGFPVLAVVHEHKHGKHNTNSIVRHYLLKKKFIKQSISFAAGGIDEVLYAIFWPLLMFSILASFTKVGYINSFSLFISAVFFILFGKVIDKKGPKTTHKIGLTINSALYIARILPLTSLFVMVIDFIDRLNVGPFSIPYNSAIYERAANSRSDSNLMIYKEITKWIGVSIGLLVAIVFVYLMPRWELIFLFLAINSPLMYFIHSKSSD